LAKAHKPTEDAEQLIVEELPAEEEAAAAEHDEQREQYLRLAAEYDNFRKRSARERESLSRMVKGDTIAALLPVADNLARALAADGSAEDLRKGLELTMAQLEAAFRKLGVEKFGEEGEEFDPKLHNAVLHIENPELGENVIAAVFEQGYRLGETIIRHAAVQVAN
jgi:molecular chaperone GrpE